MAFEITGKVIEVAPVNQVSDKFKKREFVIERKEAGGSAVFVDFIKFQLVQDRCDLINDTFMNEEVKVMFNIRGNKWERDGKVNYFTNLDAWKIDRVQSGKSDPNPVPPVNDMPADVNDIDDLPF